MTDCWACRLVAGDETERKTTWHFIDSELGAVVEDVDPKGNVMRLLYVYPEHVACGEETARMVREAQSVLSAVFKAIHANTGLVITGWDLYQHTYRDHWHVQIELNYEQE